MDKEALLAKLRAEGAAALTAEEVAFLQGETLEDADKEALAPVEELDEKALGDLVGKHVAEHMAEQGKKIADTLIAKMFKGADAQRKRVLAGSEKVEDKGRNETKAFMKALFSGDRATLRDMHAKAANNDGTPSEGGYLIPPLLQAEVLRIAQAGYGIARQEMMYLPFTGPGNTRTIPTLASVLSVGWTDEAAVKGKTNPTFGIVTQTLKKLAAIIPFTEEILEDSAINLTELIATLFVEATAKEEDLAFFRGTGSPFTGLLQNANVNKVTLPIELDADIFLDIIDATPAGALVGAKWYFHRSVRNVVRKLKDSQGRYIYSEPQGNIPATLWDYPVVNVEAFPSTSEIAGLSTGDGIIGFGNMKVAAYFGDKQQIRAKLLDQATIQDGEDTINLAERDMLALRLEERVGYVVALPKAFTVGVKHSGS